MRKKNQPPEDDYTPQQIVSSAYNAFKTAMATEGEDSKTMPQWDELLEHQKLQWLECSHAGVVKISDADGLSFKQTGCDLYQEFVKGGIGLDSHVPWDAITERAKLAWEVVGRHIANILSLDDQEDLEPHEREWREWVIKKETRL